MAVGLPRRNPYGPPSFFGPELDNPYAQQGNGYMGFLDVAQSVPTNDAPGVGTDAPMQQHDGLFEPVGPQNAVAPVQAEQPPMESYPSEASIERRMKLAQALMGKQQEVNHPLQAIGNAVNQIAGAYLENKAYKDQEKIEQRRRDAYKKALGGNTNDLGALADSLINSNDPALVDKGLEIKLQIAAASQKKGGRPDIETFYEGDESVQKAWDGEKWVEVGRGPRFAKQVAGAGGGGDGGGGRRQQGGAMQLPNGDIVAATFNPEDGQYYYQSEKGPQPVPSGSRPVSPGTGGALSQKDYNKAVKELGEDEEALRRLNSYMSRIGNTNQGYQRWADSVSANIKTLIGSGKLTQEELDLMVAKGDLQGLLGLFRVDIVGPGVLTEYDALRLIQAMGGDVNALQNPEVVRARLQELYEAKMRSAERNRDIVNRNAGTYGDQPRDIRAPERLVDPAGDRERARPAPPKQGQVVNGWQYTGGDPADKRNWRKVK